MEDAVINLYVKLRSHGLPGDQGDRVQPDSWGVNFFWDETMNNSIFPNHRLLHQVLEQAKQDLIQTGRNVKNTDLMPRFRLDDNHDGSWVLEFEYYTVDDDLDDRFSCIFKLSADQVKELLTKLHQEKIEVIDVHGNNMW